MMSSGNFTVPDMMCPCNLSNITSFPLQEDSSPFDLLPYSIDDHLPHHHRSLQDVVKTWEVVYVSLVLLLMFAILLTDKVGADMVMTGALTLFMSAQIITVDEGIAGFANEGLLTVLTLFIVAAGISHTGALDWYMGKLLGTPQSAASAQLRLMIPISIVSAFLNNTPVVAVMIPIVQRWGKNVGISPQQLLIPLSFSSIFGGTCTLIGTSTNLVVLGLLQERYGGTVTIGLFDLGQYGVPLAIAGFTYTIVASPFLLPGGRKGEKSSMPLDGEDDILLGARLTKWSSSAGRSVKRSGLRETGGLYLVSVHRAATGNVHRAVGQDFVLNVGDILYFTGLVEGFGEFCEEHGLEMITNEVQDTLQDQQQEPMEEPIARKSSLLAIDNGDGAVDREMTPIVEEEGEGMVEMPAVLGTTKESLTRSCMEERMRCINRLTDQIRGFTPSQPENELPLETDPKPIRKKVRFTNSAIEATTSPAKILVVSETRSDSKMVIVGIDAPDRPGLLLDISRGLLRLNLQLHHTEASVVGHRSLSIWRCEVLENGVDDFQEIWSVLNALLENENGIQALKKRGLCVLRATIVPNSRLIGNTAAELNFRDTYKAAIVSVQKKGKNPKEPLSQIKFDAGDVLILQVRDDSPLLARPDEDFYKKLQDKQQMPTMAKKTSLGSFVNLMKRTFSHDHLAERSDKSGTPERKKKDVDGGDEGHLEMTPTVLSGAAGDVDDSRGESTDLCEAETYSTPDNSEKAEPDVSRCDENPNDPTTVDLKEQHNTDDDYFVADLESLQEERPLKPNDSCSIVSSLGEDDDNPNLSQTPEQQRVQEQVWRDLRVFFPDCDGTSSNDKGSREFLTAMEIAPRSQLANKTATQTGISKQPGVFLVSIERPIYHRESDASLPSSKPLIITIPPSDTSVCSNFDENFRQVEPTFIPVDPDEPLQEGDVLWFSGSATSVGDLRKIPGLILYESDELKKIDEKIHDRRLVQAVVARKGLLVGKTVKEVKFRTRYGAAVIAIHREGKRVYDHPGQVKLQAGDVLLLEAGPSFVDRNSDNDRSFALLSEVKDSAPPRLRLLIPALVITIAMLAVFTAGVASLLVCSLVAAMLMICIGILSQQEARDAINWEVYITIACAFGIGTALTNSGVAGGVANFLVSISDAIGLGDAGLYAAVYFATFLISNVVTNNAAAALLFPIAMDAAEETGADIYLMSYCLMLAASASFMSPFGYTTNLLIYGPGGYKTKDFLIYGTPLQLVFWVLTVLLLAQRSGMWYLSWIVTSVILVVVATSRIAGERTNR